MKKFALALGLVASVGCYHFRTSPKDSAPATEPQTATVWSYAWGLAQNRVEVDMPSCPTRALQEVTVSSNFGFALLTIVTLGFAAPATVEWRCAKTPPTGPSNL